MSVSTSRIWVNKARGDNAMILERDVQERLGAFGSKLRRYFILSSTPLGSWFKCKDDREMTMFSVR